MLWAAARDIFLPDTYLRPHKREGVRETELIAMYAPRVVFEMVAARLIHRHLYLSGDFLYATVSTFIRIGICHSPGVWHSAPLAHQIMLTCAALKAGSKLCLKGVQ